MSLYIPSDQSMFERPNMRICNKALEPTNGGQIFETRIALSWAIGPKLSSGWSSLENSKNVNITSVLKKT